MIAPGELRCRPGRRHERRPAESTTMPAALAKKYGLATDADASLTFHRRLLLGGDPTPGLTGRG